MLQPAPALPEGTLTLSTATVVCVVEARVAAAGFVIGALQAELQALTKQLEDVWADASTADSKHSKKLKALCAIREAFRKRPKRAKDTAKYLREMVKITSKDDSAMRRLGWLLKGKGVLYTIQPTGRII